MSETQEKPGLMSRPIPAPAVSIETKPFWDAAREGRFLIKRCTACKKGEGGKFVADGNLISGVGKLPFNTDGGGLCNNHPTNRGGITKVIEAVRQLRGEAHPKVQVPNCDLAIAHGTGGSLGTRHASATVIMEREG